MRSVERIVSKYSAASIPSKKISPHGLRRTFGTNYYEATSDLYAVADALGHKNIQVTKDHYADISDRKKQQVKAFSDELLKTINNYLKILILIRTLTVKQKALFRFLFQSLSVSHFLFPLLLFQDF